jgi:anti-anti-sigma regulatory factor
MNTNDTSGGLPSLQLALPAHCTLREAAALKASLLECLEQPGPVLADAAAVERVDTAGLQALAAFARDLADTGRTLTWSGRSQEFLRAVRQLGLQTVLAVDG